MTAPVGYIVLTRCLGGVWVPDWDGELHQTLDAGRKSLAEALEARHQVNSSHSWEAVLVVAVPVDATEDVPR